LLLAAIPGALLGAAFLIFDIYRIKQELLPAVLLRIAATAGIVSVVEEFFFRGILLGLAAKSFGRWPAAIGVSIIYAGVHFLKPSKHVDSDVQWWTGLGQILRLFDSAPPLLFSLAGLVSLFIAGLILTFAAFSTRSLWLAIGLHAGWIFCQQGLQWLAKYRVQPPEALWPWIGPNVVSGAVPIGLLPLGVLLLTATGVWFYLRNALEDSRCS
jgi:membrane protease YdiL (CAAX protease family)